jgi:hypothetical protein
MKADPRYKDRHALAVKRLRARNLKYKHDYKKGKACRDCGGKYPSYVLDFDHRDPKKKHAGVALMSGRTGSIAKIQAEIDKCDIVCANCHRERTHRRKKNKPV